MFLTFIVKSLHHVCIYKIITINKCDIFTCGDFHTAVASLSKTIIFFMHHFNISILCYIPVTNLWAIIR